MDCQRVFDLVEDGLRQIWIMPLGGLALVALTAMCVVIMRRSERAWFAWLMLAIAGIFTVVSTVVPLSTYFKYRRALATGMYESVEGRVENFKPMPAGGHDNERFTIRGEEFVYGDYTNSPFFHKAAVNGGPVREGAYLKVSHVRGNIIRLEVCTPTRP
jgi:uncharacterized SAM-binding protein YcdF (DUF218 family)